MKQLSKPFPIDLTGYVMPWNSEEGAPWGVTIEGRKFIPLWSTRELMDKHIGDIKGIGAYTVKRIDDPGEFIASLIEYQVFAALDLRAEGEALRFRSLQLRFDVSAEPTDTIQ
jgi:hypothetical protein